MHGNCGSVIRRGDPASPFCKASYIAAMHNGSRAVRSGLDLNQANAYDLIHRARHEIASVRALD